MDAVLELAKGALGILQRGACDGDGLSRGVFRRAQEELPADEDFSSLYKWYQKKSS